MCLACLPPLQACLAPTCWPSMTPTVRTTRPSPSSAQASVKRSWWCVHTYTTKYTHIHMRTQRTHTHNTRVDTCTLQCTYVHTRMPRRRRRSQFCQTSSVTCLLLSCITLVSLLLPWPTKSSSRCCSHCVTLLCCICLGLNCCSRCVTLMFYIFLGLNCCSHHVNFMCCIF